MTKALFWLDLEMTGLDEKTDSILEVAVAITDMDLNILETYQKVVFQPQSVLEAMNDWCKKHHGESGLTAEVPKGTPLEKVEEELIQLVGKYYPKNERVVICGNSIGNDRRFIDKYLVKFAALLHYRMIDVSSFKEVYREKWGLKFDKANTHRAEQDIRESIKELSYYLSFIQVPAK